MQEGSSQFTVISQNLTYFRRKSNIEIRKYKDKDEGCQNYGLETSLNNWNRLS